MHKKFFEWFNIFLAIITLGINLLDITGKIKLIDRPNLIKLDNIILIYFALEYLIRFYLSKKRREFFKKNKIDLIAIIPLIHFLKVFKALKVLKIFKIVKFIKLYKLKKVLNLIKKNQKIRYYIYLILTVISFGTISISLIDKNTSIYENLIYSTKVTISFGYLTKLKENISIKRISEILMILGLFIIITLVINLYYIFIHNLEDKILECEEDILEDIAEIEKENFVCYIHDLKEQRCCEKYQEK